MLDFIYYPVSFILWCWHWVFGHVFGEASGIAWALAIVFLVFTLRAILFKPFVNQVRSMRKMQEFAPEIKKIQNKYKNDRQKQAQEIQKLQAQHGFSPLGGCLPIFLQIPVFIGLNHVLRSFVPGHTENYFFDAHGVQSYVDADLFGARLSNWITQPAAQLAEFHVQRPSVVLVSVPLMIIASIATHFTARHSVSRQNPAAATQQTEIMAKVSLYIFPLGALVFGAILPIGLLMYWLANNAWTLMQQHFVYKRIDAEEAEQKAVASEKRDALAPKPGQKPVQDRKKPTTAPTQKPATPAASASDADTTAGATTEKPAKDKPVKSDANGNGSANGTQVSGLIPDRPRSNKKSGRKNRR